MRQKKDAFVSSDVETTVGGKVGVVEAHSIPSPFSGIRGRGRARGVRRDRRIPIPLLRRVHRVDPAARRSRATTGVGRARIEGK